MGFATSEAPKAKTLKVLRIGDPHVQVSNLTEASKLMHYALYLIKENNVDRVEILGDLFHTHAIVRVEVQAFWDKWLKLLSDKAKTIVVTGNHDMTGSNQSKASALSVFKNIVNENLIIVEQMYVDGPFAYVSYENDAEFFISEANRLADQDGCTTLICHQTFAGSTFENGFYAPEGINPDLLKYNTIISGHIHKTQEFGKVIYPGTPMWLTASDANQSKGLWIFTHAADGSILNKEFYSTNSVCTPIVSVEWKEGEEKPVIPEGAKATIELIGSSEWIKANKTEFKGKISVKAKITDKVKLQSRKTGTNLSDFINSEFQPVTGVSKERLVEFMKGLNLV